MPTALCARCGLSFVLSAARQKYCSQACYLAKSRQDAAESLIARFWAKVNKHGPIHPVLGTRCWLWTASLIRGYGQFHLQRTPEGQATVYAHRYAWQLTNGPVPDNLSVLHRCDVPTCVCPDHLFLGTQATNLEDARQKGRLIDGQHLIKVSDAGVADIRANYRPRINGKALAAKYGICLVSVLRIAKGTQRVARPARKAVA